jgi:peptidoglycan/LPS O-acetylase OafA/YrhL
VVAVLAYHLDAGWAAGGYLGVEVFFVVSGFLITSLLLAEHRSTGTVGLLAFWGRRARRLLPAVFALVALVCAYGVLVVPSELHRFRGDALASLLYVQNWHAVVSEQPYFDAFGRPSPLRHLWSLAIEEQFYLLWPLLLPLGLRRLGPRRTAGLVTAAVVASAAIMAATADVTAPERAYYGTDSRLFGILLGALLAFGWRPQRARTDVGLGARRVVEGAGIAALVLLAQQHAGRSEFDPWTYPWGFLLVDIATLVAIVAVTHPASRLERWVGCGPLQALGRRSYSIYLWHWPVIVFTRPGVDWGLTAGTALVARLVLIAALSEASYRLVEQPVRDGRLQAWLTAHSARSAATFRLRRTAVAGGLAALVLVVAVGSAPVPRQELATGVSADRPNAITIDPTAPVPDPVVTTTTTAPPSAPDPAAVPADATTDTAPAAVAPPTTLPAPTDPLPGYPAAAFNAVTIIGESVTLGAARALQAHWGDHVQIDAVEGRQFHDGVAVLEGLAAAGRLTPVVILHLGNNGVAQPEWWDRAVAAVGPERRLVVVSVRVPKRWEAQVNGEVLRIVGQHPNAVLADWNTASSSEPGLLIGDGVHPTPRGIEVYRDLLVRTAGG